MVKKIFPLFLVCLTLFSTVSTAQANGPKLWIENPGGLSQDQLTNGKVVVGHGFFGGYDLEDLVKDNPSALALAAKQSQLNTYAHLSYWLGVIPSAFTFGFGIGKQDTTMTIVSAVALLGTSILTGHFISESRHYMYEAINEYNGVRTQGDTRVHQVSTLSSSSFQPSLASNTLTFSFSF